MEPELNTVRLAIGIRNVELLILIAGPEEYKALHFGNRFGRVFPQSEETG